MTTKFFPFPSQSFLFKSMIFWTLLSVNALSLEMSFSLYSAEDQKKPEWTSVFSYSRETLRVMM